MSRYLRFHRFSSRNSDIKPLRWITPKDYIWKGTKKGFRVNYNEPCSDTTARYYIEMTSARVAATGWRWRCGRHAQAPLLTACYATIAVINITITQVFHKGIILKANMYTFMLFIFFPYSLQWNNFVGILLLELYNLKSTLTINMRPFEIIIHHNRLCFWLGVDCTLITF